MQTGRNLCTLTLRCCQPIKLELPIFSRLVQFCLQYPLQSGLWPFSCQNVNQSKVLFFSVNPATFNSKDKLFLFCWFSLTKNAFVYMVKLDSLKPFFQWNWCVYSQMYPSAFIVLHNASSLMCCGLITEDKPHPRLSHWGSSHTLSKYMPEDSTRCSVG